MNVVFYDGECGLCANSVKWLRWMDRGRALRYAPLQGKTAEEVLGRHGKKPGEMSGLWFAAGVGSAEERLWHRSDGVLQALRWCGRLGPVLASARFVPRAIREAVYGWIARNRYRFFGRRDSCDLPSPAERELFLP
jgi:predicted DCC family thiol-disulfide oxidoreductase YuxK